MSEIRAISMMGRELRLRSDEPAEHLQALARYVDGKVQQVSGKKPDGADPHLLMVASLQLADEVFKLRAQQAELAAKLRSTSRSLLGRIPGSTDPRTPERDALPPAPQQGITVRS